MIFIIKHNDRIYFNLQQLKNFAKAFDELYKLQTSQPRWWFSRHNFIKYGKKHWFNKYMMYSCLFGYVRIRTDTFLVKEKNIKYYKYKIINMDKALAFKNAVIESINKKDKMVVFNCRKCKVIKDE